MVSKPHYDYGLLWRAIAISLLGHALLLLQPGFGKDALQASGAQSLIALLRPRAEVVSATAPSAMSAQQMRRSPAQMNELPAVAAPMASAATAIQQAATAAASSQWEL